MTDKKILSALDSCDVFSKASDTTYKELLSCSPKHFNPGELIYSAESFEKSLGIIVSGKVEVYGETGNRRVRLNTLSHGDMFGAAALFGKDNGYVSTVISKTASDVLFVSESKVKELITSDSQVALAYISFLSDRIRFLNRKISAFTAKNADSAVATAMLGERNQSFELNVSRLSKKLGIGRTSVYRSLESLERLGAIKYSEGTVVILSEDILKSVR